MHQTTVRFGGDLWAALAVEAERLGVSVAQYVRDAALRRLSYEAGRRDELERSGEPAAQSAPGDARAAQDRAASEMSESAALWAQGRQARHRAAELRTQTERTRAKLLHLRT
jgi:hypothetical protein